MRAASLFTVFVLARAITLAERDIPFSIWSLPAYLWQDLLLALLFYKLDSSSKRQWPGWFAYGALVVYTAVNVPVIRVLSSPLTWPMMQAARETLADSISYHLTADNMVLALVVMAAGALLPLGFRRFSLKMGDTAVLAALGIVALGPAATTRIATVGLHRHPLSALVTSALPRIDAAGAREDWRASPFETTVGQDLSRLRGSVAGRNLVLVVLESAGARYLPPYGARENPMPNLTALAERSLLFENAYAVYPESIKGLFSVLCSAYPALDTPLEVYASDRFPSIASVLSSSGYRTALFHSGRFMYLGMDSILESRGFGLLEDAGAIGGNFESSFGVDEESTVRRMLAWIDSLLPEERFFLAYLPVAGHHPYATPGAGPFPAKEEIDRFRNALYYGDSALGLFLRELRARGLDQKTVFAFAGDHGEAFGQHPGNYGHTLFVYEENVRVPFLIHAPGLLDNPIRVARAASLLDSAPTLLDLLGEPAPLQFQGASLLQPEPRMALFYTDYSLGFLGLRDGCFKYIYEMESDRSSLFSICEDSDERADLSGRHPDRVVFYQDRVQRWAAAQKDHLSRPR